MRENYFIVRNFMEIFLLRGWCLCGSEQNALHAELLFGVY
jgi:hypothetical protein